MVSTLSAAWLGVNSENAATAAIENRVILRIGASLVS
jgi:hypothetical protein